MDKPMFDRQHSNYRKTSKYDTAYNKPRFGKKGIQGSLPIHNLEVYDYGLQSP